MALAPACKRQEKRAALITAGTVATAGGATALTAGPLLTVWHFAHGIQMPLIGAVIAGVALLGGGIAMILKVPIKRKK